MVTKLVLFLYISVQILAVKTDEQLFFPDQMPVASLSSQPSDRLSAPEAIEEASLPEKNETTAYEDFVDNIISNGILKTTLAINKVIATTSRTNQDNIVFAPLSITGALALLLLGSNGKTFQEITSLMGLATGVVDINEKSQIIHEQLGRMIRKLEHHSGFDVGRQVNFATAIFLQENFPIRTMYKQTAETIYESEVLNVNFNSNPTAAQKVINAWVSDRTNGKIADILNDSPSQSTKVIIVSAMYFKSKWEVPFWEGTTKKHPFFPNGRKSPTDIKVEMMSNGGSFPYYRDPELKCEIMGFPYKGNQTTMYVVMPFHSNTTILKDLELRLTPEEMTRLVERTVYTPSLVLFPKMKIESTIDLKQALESLGVKSLFDPHEANLALLSPGGHVANQVANTVINPLAANRYSETDDILIFSRFGETKNCSAVFDPNNTVNICTDVASDKTKTPGVARRAGKIGRITKQKIETLDNLRHTINQESSDNSYQNPGLYADKVIHKVYMDITESGTEAAASTAVSLSRDGGRVTFRVDVPFFFFIRHEETKTVLFWGTVNTPTPNFKFEHS